jgi:F420-non-reducing hydrogenase iron-sulfur subunit
LKNVLKSMGIDEGRVRLEWISASEGDRVQKVMNEMSETVRQLGPLRLEIPKEHEGAVHGAKGGAR